MLAPPLAGAGSPTSARVAEPLVHDEEAGAADRASHAPPGSTSISTAWPRPNARRSQGSRRSPPCMGLRALSVGGEPVLTLAEPALTIAGVALTPPPGAFVQASAEAEAAMAALVVGASCRREARRRSFLRRRHVRAGARAQRAGPCGRSEPRGACGALASRAAAVGAEAGRDGDARPLRRSAVAEGAGDSSTASSSTRPMPARKRKPRRSPRRRCGLVAAVSCNPATFARDARILVDGGYALERVVPVDQFVYSAETEVVGLFRRD